MKVRGADNKLSALIKVIKLFRNKFSNERRAGFFPVLLLFMGVFFLLSSADVYADTHKWNGEGADNKWSTADNWDVDDVPIIGDDVVFDGTTGTNPDKDCTIDELGKAGSWVDSHTNQFNSCQVQSGYGGIITQSHQFYSKDINLNLTNALTWTVNAADMEPENFTVSGGTFTTDRAFWSWGNFTCSGNGTITQTSQWTVMEGTAAKTVTNTGTGTISFYKFEDNSDTSATPVAPFASTTISCNISVTGPDGLVSNNWNGVGDGYLIIDTNVTVTVSGGFYNKGKTETKSGSTVKVAGDIELDRYVDGVAQNQAWSFDTNTSAGGIFEWTNNSAGRHVWPNSNADYSKFYDFKVTGTNDLYVEKYPLYTLNDFTVTAGKVIESSGMYIGDAAGDDIIMTGGRLEAKKFITVAGNITLTGDNTLFWGTGDGYPTIVTFGGTFSCEAGKTNKFQAEWCTNEGGGTKYFKLVGAAGGIRSFTGSDSQFVQTPSLGVCQVYLDNIYLNLSDALTRGADQKITLAGNCQFNAITLNGDADTLFDTGAKTATVGGTFTNTFGTVTIAAGGEIDATGQDIATAANGTITLVGASTLKADDIHNDGIINLDHNSNEINITGSIDNDGTIDATGTTAKIYLMGNWDNAATATFTCGTSLVTFDGTAAGQTVTSNNDAYHDITVANTNAAGVTFADAFTAATLIDITADSKLTFNAGDTYTITDAAGVNSGLYLGEGLSAGDEITLISDNAGTQFIFHLDGGAQAVKYVNVKDSAVTADDVSFNITAATSINSGGNDDGGATPHWIFGPVTRYWVAAGLGVKDWNTNANWSSTSGGAIGADFPKALDTAIFDNGSDLDCILDADVAIAVIELRGAADPGGAYDGKLDANTYDIAATSTVDITSGELELDTLAAAVSDLHVDGTLTVDGGTLDGANGTINADNNVAISAGTLIAPNATMNVSGNWTISGAGAFTCGTGTVEFDSAAAGQAVTSLSKTYHTITVSNTHAAGVTFADPFTTENFNDITPNSKLTFDAGDTYTITGAAGSLNIHGQAAGTKIHINSDDTVTPTQFIFDFDFPQAVNFVDLSNCSAAADKAGTAYNSEGELQNNTNWTFDALAITIPAAGSFINQRSTIIGTATAGDNVVIRGTVLGAAFTQVATAIADANGNYRVRPSYVDAAGVTQSDYTATLDVGANNIRCDVGASQGAAVAVTVANPTTTEQTPTITSPAVGGRVNGSTPTISGKRLANQAVALWASDANGNLLLKNVANIAAGASTDWTINSADYITPLVKGINYLSVVVNGVASDITSVTFTDPFGVVFDSVTNSLIAGATVTIFNQNGTRCTPGVEIAAGDANPQTTGADGAYNFLTINANFYITVSAAGYNFPSTVTNIPAGRVIVNGSRGEVFTVAGVVIQMDFPMDSNDMLLKIKKTANKKEAVIGDIVTYTVTIKNLSSTPVTGVYLADQIPAGFKYIKGKAILDNVPLEPSGSRPIMFNIGAIAAGVTRTLKYQLVIGSGVTQGNYENTAWAQYLAGRIISNKDRQTVKVVLDPLFDLGTIIGKVFWDKNESGYQEAPKKTDEEIEAEAGIPDVQIAMEDGAVVTTDKDGKYHIQAITPGRHLLRINEGTLPDGAYLTTDKVIVIDTTPGLLSKVNFGVNSKDKGRKEIEKSKAPVKILQKEQKPKPFLNVSLYPSGVISYQGCDFEVKPLPDDYEFKIFTNYSLFIKTWKLEILDKDTRALVKSFSGTSVSLPEPVYWDGRDKYGKSLNPQRNYVYILSVMDKTGRTDTTKEKDLRVVSYKPEILEASKAEDKRLKTEWLKNESRANNLSSQNIKLSDKVVVVESKGGFEAKQSAPKALKSQESLPEPRVEDTSEINIMVDQTSVPVLAPSQAGEDFTQEVIVPEGEHKVTVEAVDKEGKKEGRTEYIKDKDNYLLLVAMGDAKAGYTFQSGNIEPVTHDSKFKEGLWSEQKLAYYLKGKILGKYLITSSLDTERDQKALFRNLDPNKYYPVYGDASKVNYDATNTQGILYLLVEWDKSSALWGNYQTDFKDTEFATFARTLYGAKVHYEDVSTTQFGEPATKLVVFKATAKQQAAHNEFVGTGGSLFYLKNKNVNEGSEKVSIEVRDKVTGLVLATLAQEEGFDYEVDYDNGRIMFWESVSHIAESSSIVSSALLSGNPVYVVVDYEWETLEKYDEGVYGARAEQSVTDYVRLGGTYIREDQQDKNYGLVGVDTTLHLGKNTTITGEFARSKSQELGRFISTDGGLTFAQLLTEEAISGKAYGVKGESHIFDKLGVSGYYKKIEKDFSSISTASQQGKQLVGAAVTYDITPKTRLTAKHDIQELLDDGNPQTQLQVGAKKTETTTAQITHAFDDKLKVTGEYRHQKVEDKIEKYKSETNENGDLAALRADYKLTEKTSLFAEQQATLKGSPNNQTTAGIDTKLNEYVSLRGKETVGTRGNATSVGAYTNITDRFKISSDYTLANYKTGDIDKTASVTASAKVDDNSEVYNTYSQTSSSLEGKKNSSVFGAKKTLGNGLELTMEQQEANSKREVSDTNILGASGNLNDKLALTAKFERGVVQDFDGTRYERNAPSLSLSYVDKNKIKASLKTEARLDSGTEDKRQYLIYAALEDKITQDLTLFAKANVANSANTTKESTLAFYKEFTLGAAYRPVNFDRLNLLTRYNYLSNTSPTQQIDIEDVEGYKAHILSGEAAYDITDRWQVIEKLAIRMAEEKVTGFEFTKTRTWLMVSRLNYNINRDWQVGAEYRRLAQSQAKDAKQGALIEVAKNIGEYVQAGVGYNFTDFSDDLTSLDYTSQGPFIRLTGKLFDRTPEEIERLRQKREEERIKQWIEELVNYELRDPDSQIAQELRHYYYVAERAKQEGKLQTAKRYYAKVIQTGNMMKQEAEEYVRKRVELEKTLARDDELAKAYYKEGRLQEAKQLWEKIIKEGSVDICPAKW